MDRRESRDHGYAPDLVEETQLPKFSEEHCEDEETIDGSQIMSDAQSFYVAFRFDEEEGDADAYFLSEGLDSVEAWVANGGKRSNDATNAQGDPSELSDAHEPREEEEEFPFRELTSKFIHSMNRLRHIVSATMTLLPMLERIRMNRQVYEPLAKSSRRIAKSGSFEIYECDFDRRKLFNTVGRQLHELRDGRDKRDWPRTEETARTSRRGTRAEADGG
ncbi:hypothetical protein [Bradyrhizobium sp. B120]|uniref:hypothetical protein n=1 Tax=Bradyrhizobium sp. B120 TaxID=3410088 RepID=UPI003B986005